MDTLWAWAGFLLLLSGAIPWLHAKHRARRWRRAGAHLGLSFDGSWWGTPRRLSGTLDGLAVQVEVLEQYSGGASGKTTRFRVTGPDLPADLMVLPPGVAPEGAGRVRTGDEEFDAGVFAAGPELSTIAALDFQTRKDLATLVRLRGGGLHSGVLLLPVAGVPTEVASILETVRSSVAAVRRLSLERKGVRDRLAHNATRDPNPGARHRNLELLLAHYAESPVTEAALRAAVQDLEPRIRLLAGTHLGQAGWDALISLVAKEDLPDEVRSGALLHLVGELPRERLVPLLEGLAEGRSAAVFRIGVRSLTRLGRPLGFDRLVGALRGAPAAVAAVIAEELGETGDPRAEETSIRLLGHEDAQVRLRAAATLGRVGGLRAVEPLRGCAGASGRLLDGELRRAIDAAVKAIHARLGVEGGVGSLSLADPGPGAGTLSLATEEGALSLAPKEAARDAASRAVEKKSAGEGRAAAGSTGAGERGEPPPRQT
ncbi:MAG: HEAT repeat domain-containing protein [Planctomycetes bacterium]|nr:HEAT repeat domain-containing protein [Planctomycetota bacterium]